MQPGDAITAEHTNRILARLNQIRTDLRWVFDHWQRPADGSIYAGRVTVGPETTTDVTCSGGDAILTSTGFSRNAIDGGALSPGGFTVFRYPFVIESVMVNHLTPPCGTGTDLVFSFRGEVRINWRILEQWTLHIGSAALASPPRIWKASGTRTRCTSGP